MSDPIPSGLECRRLAVAMAAGSGLRLDKLEAEDRAAFDKHANSALLYLGMRGEIAADHIAERMEGIVNALRSAATAMDSDPGNKVPEAVLQALYARAGDAEVISRILRGLPLAEPPETV